MPNRRTTKRPPVFRKFSAMPKGPAYLKLRSDPKEIGGPGEPPPHFVVGQTSKSEWYVYWSLSKILGSPKNPRQPPFIGGDDWVYQKNVDGGRKKGGAVVDFYITTFPPIAIRLQSEIYHIFTTAFKQAYDALQKQDIAENAIVIDVFEQDFIWDITGDAVCKVMAQAVKGEQRVDVLGSGRGQRVRP